jgi:hypothetical protein
MVVSENDVTLDNAAGCLHRNRAHGRARHARSQDIDIGGRCESVRRNVFRNPRLGHRCCLLGVAGQYRGDRKTPNWYRLGGWLLPQEIMALYGSGGLIVVKALRHKTDNSHKGPLRGILPHRSWVGRQSASLFGHPDVRLYQSK